MTDPLLDLFAHGPWTWEWRQAQQAKIVILDQDRMVIAHVAPRGNTGEQEAHARLIVKSWELLRHLRNVHVMDYQTTPFGRAAVENILAEIAGAGGG